MRCHSKKKDVFKKKRSQLLNLDSRVINSSWQLSVPSKSFPAKSNTDIEDTYQSFLIEHLMPTFSFVNISGSHS